MTALALVAVVAYPYFAGGCINWWRMMVERSFDDAFVTQLRWENP
jgi:hypothetical protein